MSVTIPYVYQYEFEYATIQTVSPLVSVGLNLARSSAVFETSSMSVTIPYVYQYEFEYATIQTVSPLVRRVTARNPLASLFMAPEPTSSATATLRSLTRAQ